MEQANQEMECEIQLIEEHHQEFATMEIQKHLTKRQQLHRRQAVRWLTVCRRVKELQSGILQSMMICHINEVNLQEALQAMTKMVREEEGRAYTALDRIASQMNLTT